MSAPKPSRDWRKRQRDDWDAFWASDLAEDMRPTDVEVVRRLFDLRDELHRARQMLRKTSMLVKGSTGQPRPSPLIDVIQRWEIAALRLEAHIGLTPASRLLLSRRADGLDDTGGGPLGDLEDPDVIDEIARKRAERLAGARENLRAAQDPSGAAGGE